ncbi:hypothetical protein EW026_g1123 [Hermanssonia centrifuga]|uniref:Uncharacterized protein n=1 Tax=Hermanssonia centrifuga TaxID=98765 RepID=A0A4S4KSI5_9APHY|nr:hypothetical protein EW026_g1123 [Hermanssonia centrifuga]
MCVSDENEFVRTYDVITSATYVEAKEVFTKDVVSQLPYAVSTRTGTLDYTGFLIDEERLVGMKDAAFAEGHVSDIDVFTF